jgi:hypothetical protein
MQYQPVGRTVTVTNGSTFSDAKNLGARTLLGLRFPSQFDGTTVTFLGCDTQAGTYDPLYSDDGSLYTVTCAASRYVAVDYTKFLGVLWVKVVTGTTQATTDTIITLYLIPMFT